MPLALVAALVLAAGPSESFKVAMPGFTLVNLDDKSGDLYSDYLAQRLRAAGGLRVVTNKEVATLLGFERQRQLLHCTEGGCTAELAGALGVDALVVGSLGRVGSEFVVTLEFLRASDARVLASTSGRLANEEALLDWLGLSASGLIARGRGNMALARGAALTTDVAVSTGPTLRSRAWIPWAGGGALLVAGGVLYGLAAQRQSQVNQGSGGYTNAAALDGAISQGQTFQSVGLALFGTGLLAAAVGGGMYLWGGEDAPVVQVAPTPIGILISGRWP